MQIHVVGGRIGIMILRSISGDFRLTLLPIRGAYVARAPVYDSVCAQLREEPCAARDAR
jgi:hypothetical protein